MAEQEEKKAKKKKEQKKKKTSQKSGNHSLFLKEPSLKNVEAGINQGS